MAVLGDTLVVSGTRITTSGQSFVCCWVVESHLTTPSAGEGVAYLVRSDGKPVVGGNLTARTVVQPNFSAVDSPLPGVSSGMAPVECYSVTLDMDSLPTGTLTVEGIAQGHDGSLKVMTPFVILNDRDGVDRRPSSAVVYWDYDDGDDGNGGTGWGDAVATLNRAIQLAKVGTNCGGAQILARGDIKGNGGAAISGVWETGPLHWLTITADSGATWSRLNPPFSSNFGGHDDNIACNAAGGYCRVRLQGFWIQGTGPIFNAGSTGSTIQVWREGCKWGSVNWDGTMSVLCHEDDNDCISLSPPTAIHRSYVTGELRQGGKNGWNNEGLVFDCYAQGTMGGSTYIQGPQQSCVFHSIISTEHSYERNVTRGWADSDEGADLEIDATGGAGGVARILGPIGGVDFGAQCDEIAGAARTKIGIFGFPTGANNGNFTVVGGGTTGGRSYCDYVNASAASEVGTASANLETMCENTSGGYQRYNEYIHTSYLSVGTDRTGNDVLRDIANFAIADETQTVFTNGASHNGLLIDNCRSAGGFSNVNLSVAFGTASITNSIMRRCSFTGSTLQTHASAIDYSGTVIENCVFNSIGSDAPGAITNGLTIRYCHTIGGAGPAGATNHSTGTWLAGDPTESPYSMEPDAGVLGTGDPRMANTLLWAWTPSQSTKGATKAVASLEWDVRGGPTGSIEAVGSVTGTASVSGTALVGILATGSVTGTASIFASATVGTAAASSVAPMAVRTARVETGGQLTAAVTPSDSTILRCSGFRVTVGGLVSITMEDDSTVSLPVPSGVEIPLRCKRINQTGTTATGIVAYY